MGLKPGILLRREWSLKLVSKGGKRDAKHQAEHPQSRYGIDNENPWEEVNKWRERLSDCKNYPVQNGLESAGRMLSDDYGPSLKRDSQPTKNLLAALFHYVDLGFYHPPELLFSLLNRWEAYLEGSGELSLDDVFLGPQREGVGAMLTGTKPSCARCTSIWK